MTAVVRNLFRTATVHAQPGNLVTDNPTVTDGELGGDCLCGRGQTIGTCSVTDTRLSFRAFHEKPAVYHFQNVTAWACVDCVADAALDVANGVIKERMREVGRQRAEEMAAMMRRNEMRKEAGLPLAAWIDEDGNERFAGGRR